MNRIDNTWARLASENRKALIPYLVAGDPGLDITVPTMHAMVANGADIIELGVPFSDPMAEGPVIQKAHERALVHHTSLTNTLAMVAEFRQQDASTPVVLMGYANPIERMGYETFASRAQTAGVDGTLIVDMPPEEGVDLQAAMSAKGLHSVYLLAPTTTAQRCEKINALASGYLYYVSLKGVTGAGHLDIDAVAAKVAEIRQISQLPLCVGFGIKDGSTAAAVARVADGAVVGSVLVDCMAKLASEGSSDPQVYADAVGALLRPMREALDA